MILCIDIDGVLADTMTTWLEWYNQDFDDYLKLDDITAWDITRFIKPSAKSKIYEYLKDPDFYDHVKPLPGAQDGVKRLRLMGHRVVFVTSSILGQQSLKYMWLQRNGLCNEHKDYIEASDKSLIRADIMLDDGFHNVQTFPGKAYLFGQPWNAQATWPNRVKSWPEFCDLIEWYPFS